jgi:hypothetical protein
VFLRQGEEIGVACGVCGYLCDVYLLLVHNLHLTCLPCEVSYGCDVYLCLVITCGCQLDFLIWLMVLELQ